MKVNARSKKRAAAEVMLSANDKRPTGQVVGIVVALLLLALLAAAWRWTPLREWLDRESLVALADYLQEGPYTPLAVAGAYLIASLVMFPVTVLNLVIIVVFGPLVGPVYAISGATLAAAATYGIGRRLGRKTVRRVAGARLNRLSERLAQRGVLAMSVLRFVPVAPFTVVNLVAGASHIGFRDFILGSVIGMAPGITATTLFVNRAAAVFRDPGIDTVALLVAVVAAIAAAIFFLRRRLNDSAGA
jgi:phospholipase D1/2